MQGNKRLWRQAKCEAMRLAESIPSNVGYGYVVQNFYANPILIGYRDRWSDEWITLATVGVEGDQIIVNDELLSVL